MAEPKEPTGAASRQDINRLVADFVRPVALTTPGTVSESEPRLGLFDVVLRSVPSDNRLQAIAAIRQARRGLTLREAVSLVDALPSNIYTGISWRHATEVAQVLGEAGVAVTVDAQGARTEGRRHL